jgi:hypothetical protein
VNAASLRGKEGRVVGVTSEIPPILEDEGKKRLYKEGLEGRKTSFSAIRFKVRERRESVEKVGRDQIL